MPAAATAQTNRLAPAYTRCKPRVANSRFASEAWVRVGEHHFDEGQLAAAIAAYQQVVRRGPGKNPYYDSALYKLAWAFYRADRYQQAIAHFDRLVLFADKASGPLASPARP